MRARIAFIAFLIASPAVAQLPDNDLMVAQWERNKQEVLNYVDAMPDSALAYKPFKEVRTFAHMIEHLSQANVLFASAVLAGSQTPPSLGDSTAYLHSKAALHDYVAKTYDWVITALKSASDSTLGANATEFGQTKPAWLWMELAREHAVWTLSQTVAYLRGNGVTPPGYLGF
jgi:hypothetical protein